MIIHVITFLINVVTFNAYVIIVNIFLEPVAIKLRPRSIIQGVKLFMLLISRSFQTFGIRKIFHNKGREISQLKWRQ